MSLNIFGLLAVVGVIAVSANSDELVVSPSSLCPNNYVYMSSANKCLGVVYNNGNWFNAEKECQSINGSLLSIHNIYQQRELEEFVVNFVNVSRPDGKWTFVQSNAFKKQNTGLNNPLRSVLKMNVPKLAKKAASVPGVKIVANCPNLLNFTNNLEGNIQGSFYGGYFYNCEYHLGSGSLGNRVTLTIRNLTTERSYDKLTVYDGDSVNSPLLGVYSGSVQDEVISSSGPDLTLVYNQDDSNAGDGDYNRFSLNYKFITAQYGWIGYRRAFGPSISGWLWNDNVNSTYYNWSPQVSSIVNSTGYSYQTCASVRIDKPRANNNFGLWFPQVCTDMNTQKPHPVQFGFCEKPVENSNQEAMKANREEVKPFPNTPEKHK